MNDATDELRRNLCERTVHLEADMEDVQAENAKLRGWMLDALTVITNLECLVHTMQAQKEWTDEEAEFVEGTLSNNEFMTLDDLARELGVEVDE